MHPKKLFCLIGQLGNGGTEKQLFLFLRYLDKKLYEPTVVVSSSSEGKWKKYISGELSIPVISLGSMPKIMKLAKFRCLIAKYQPDTVLSWSFFTNAFCSVSGSSRFIGGLRGDLYAAKKQLGALHWKQCLKPSCFTVNSSLLAEELKREGIAENNISVIYNIFEQGKNDNPPEIRRKLIRKQYNIPDDAIVIAGIGRDTPEKDFPFFLDVFAKTVDSVDKIHGFIIGSGANTLRREIRNRGLETKITLAGETENASELLFGADIYFLSSKTEGMPNVLLEAIDAGCAILTTDVGGVRDILGGINNKLLSEIILEDRDVDVASKKLISLLKDPGLRKNINTQAGNQLSNFSPEKIMSEYYHLLTAESQ